MSPLGPLPRLQPFDLNRCQAAYQAHARAAGIQQPIYWHYRPQVDSTQHVVKQAYAQGPAQAIHVVVADTQTAGIGRHGRTWYSPWGLHIYLSCSYSLPRPPEALGGLSLAVGCALARACQHPRVGIKWPNDLVIRESPPAFRKWGGILIALERDPWLPTHTVAYMGIGLNVGPDPQYAQAPIQQPWTELAALYHPNPPPSREHLIASWLPVLLADLAVFSTHGWPALAHHWPPLDVLYGQPWTGDHHGVPRTGIARGVTENGYLQIEQAGQIWHVVSSAI